MVPSHARASNLHISAAGLRQRATPGKQPARTTKNTQKLVLFPQESQQAPYDQMQQREREPAQREQPYPPQQHPNDTSGQPWFYMDAASNFVEPPHELPYASAATTRTEAELLSKERRTELPRVTCYCAADSYKLKEVTKLLGETDGVISSFYDECLYVAHDGDAAVWEVLIGEGYSVNRDRRENQRPNHWFDYTATSPVHHTALSPKSPVLEAIYNQMPFSERNRDGLNRPRRSASMDDAGLPISHNDHEEEEVASPLQPKWMHRKEVFVFDFGVVVFWNFLEEEELRYVARLKAYAGDPFEISDYEIEDFHFQYDLGGPFQPRIYNDMITLKSGNPLIKLTISHAVAQSAKLTLFENVMEEEIVTLSALPKMMAEKGEVSLPNGRTDVIKVVGRLFKLRMNVNLISNVLDTPEIFWSEPELSGLYNAIRGYVEITQRVKVLNTRVEVISDLLDMLQDHLNGSEMTSITIIIIALIVITCFVATGEVIVKVLLETREHRF